MPQINAIQGSQSPTAPSKKTNSLEDLDVNQFLQLMISELTNQDPLNPMDNTQLVQQLGSIREIAATNQLTTTLGSMQTSQSLTTASSLLGKEIKAMSADGDNITGTVDRVSVEVDSDNNDKRSYRVHIGSQAIDLDNVREVVS
jgi:flagellar basal-body rod modification protein FlgD